MKKILWLLVHILLIFLFIPSVLLQAQTNSNETIKVNQAYSCLQNRTNNCLSLSTEEKIFSVLATGRCKSELLSTSTNNAQCWSDISGGNCKVKPTAQAILALNKMNQPTTSAQNWLISQNKSAPEITWFLQIDSQSDETTCTVSYGPSSYTFSINENKELSDDAGVCLQRAEGNYWFSISSSANCAGQEFSVSCDKDFQTTLLFSKQGSPTIHVFKETRTSQAGGTIDKIKTQSYCFADNNLCNYEATLWGALVLDKLNKDVSPYMPYLITMKEDNSRFLPEAFLLFITPTDNNYRTSLISKQINNKYWSASGDRYYDTALALYPFQGENPTEKLNAKEWLLENQDANGCWQGGNIRNTAFILHSIWPRTVTSGGSGGGSDLPSCQNASYYCVPSSSACTLSGGQDVSAQYDCPGVSVCCTQQYSPPTCIQLNGTICNTSTQVCSVSTISASGLSPGQVCCPEGGVCNQISQTPSQCEVIVNGTCRPGGCLSDEDSTPYSCPSSQFCCIPKKASYTWIWILIILIVLAVLGIIFRKKLREFLLKIFKKKPKAEKLGSRFTGLKSTTPQLPPPLYTQRPILRYPLQERKVLIPPSQQQQPTPSSKLKTPSQPSEIKASLRPASPSRIKAPPQPSSRTRTKASKELDEVLKKLKEMGK